MPRSINADGERWEISVDEKHPHPGVTALVFFCASRGGRPYRVVEVPTDQVPGPEALDRLDTDELEQLFSQSDVMDYVHEGAADPEHPEGHPLKEPG